MPIPRRVCFGITYTKIGTIQRRLAWPLRKDDTQIREAFQIFGTYLFDKLKQYINRVYAPVDKQTEIDISQNDYFHNVAFVGGSLYDLDKTRRGCIVFLKKILFGPPRWWGAKLYALKSRLKYKTRVNKISN